MFTVNNYFDNKVTSIAFEGETLPATVGVIAPGEYSFDTSKHETMSIVSGSMEVQFKGSDDWQTFEKGSQFEVEANSVFSVRTQKDCAYLCTYA